MLQNRNRPKGLLSQKRIVSSIKKLDIMRFIVVIFTSFSPKIEFYLILF